MKDISSSAAALFDGGWRSSDLQELKEEYELSTKEAEEICLELLKIEEAKK